MTVTPLPRLGLPLEEQALSARAALPIMNSRRVVKTMLTKVEYQCVNQQELVVIVECNTVTLRTQWRSRQRVYVTARARSDILIGLRACLTLPNRHIK